MMPKEADHRAIQFNCAAKPETFALEDSLTKLFCGPFWSGDVAIGNKVHYRYLCFSVC